MTELLWGGGKAFAAALILTPIFRDIFKNYNVVDRPGYRKVHAYPIPRVGGIPIALAYGLALLSFRDPGQQWSANAPVAIQIIPGALLVFAVGLLDDFFNLKPLNKLLGLLLSASIVFWSGLRVSAIAGHELAPWVSYPLTVFWLLLTSNALNLIDGLDGLCAGMGLFATLTLFAAALLHADAALAYMTFPMAGALLGFLCYNTNPATIFLGDSGALLIGFLLGCYGMLWTEKTSTFLSILVPVLALSVPLLDVSLSVVRRFLRNRPIFGSDRGHIHHRLLDRGLSPRKAVWILYLFAMLAAAFALLVSSVNKGSYQGLLMGAFCVAIWVGIRQLRYTEFDIFGRLFFGGEFYRNMEFRVKLLQVGANLEEAATEDAWWGVLVRGAKSFGLASVRWEAPGGSREERLVKSGGPSWTFRVPLRPAAAIELEGLLNAGGNPIDLIALANTIQRSYPKGWEPRGHRKAMASSQ
jgi:UDP-GlcNAc:undecaprenyl-phosphate/decaprenyl-phosphate GlcNAc-1-phosphate transferase